MYRVNVDATESLLRIAARAGVERIVHCSSVAAVKILDNRVPSTESDEYLSPDEVIGDYKKSKFLSDRMARDLARKEGLPIIVVNPTAPIGPYDIKPTPTGRIVVDFLNGRMPSYIDTGMNIVHSEDVAIGHWLAATRGRIGERYILGGENLTFKAILDQLAAITGLKAPLFQTPYAVAYAYGALDTAISRLRGVEPRAPLDAVKMAKHYMWFSSTKAQQELGYRARPAQLALTDAVNWFTTHGYVTRLLHA
jgi:dihydroflavonol-4-reductase